MNYLVRIATVEALILRVCRSALVIGARQTRIFVKQRNTRYMVLSIGVNVCQDSADRFVICAPLKEQVHYTLIMPLERVLLAMKTIYGQSGILMGLKQRVYLWESCTSKMTHRAEPFPEKSGYT